MEGLVGYDSRFRDFGPVKSGRIFTYSLDAGSAVPNPYFEEATLRADLLLEDLITIRNGGGSGKMNYYRQVR